MASIKRPRSNSNNTLANIPTSKRPKAPQYLPAKPIKRPNANLLNNKPVSSSHAQGHQIQLPKHVEPPKGGILPTDTFQDVPLESIETSAIPATAGASQYRRLLAQNPWYPSIGVSFEQYRTAGRDPRAIRNLDKYIDWKPDLGHCEDGIDYTKAARSRRLGSYQLPVYKGMTYNPMIPLAIIRVAEKNLPFVNFDSALNHLPNLSVAEKYPLWRNDIDFIDEDTVYIPSPTDSWIRVVFMPNYYMDGRHSIGFFTRKLPSQRLSAILFTPCTVADLKAAKLWTVFGGDKEDGKVEDDFAWEDILVGVDDGEWFHVDVVEEYEHWRAAIAVEKDWMLRLALTLNKIEEGSWEAARRDDGRWGEDWWE